MKYVSTRNAALRYDAAQVITQGLSRDGGLFTPEMFPKGDQEMLEALVPAGYQERAVKLIGLFLEEFSEEEVNEYAGKAYAVDKKFDTEAVAPDHHVTESAEVLELWHGPTCAFKDFALQMLPYLLTASLNKTGEQKTACILVATSGDTGKAASGGLQRCAPHQNCRCSIPRTAYPSIQKLQMVTQGGRQRRRLRCAGKL